jgi:hypothetical protein
VRLDEDVGALILSKSFVSLQTPGLCHFGAISGGLMMDYDLADYLLTSLPADEREETVASLRRANAAEFRRMREKVVRDKLLDEAGAVAPVREGAFS